MEEQEKKNYDYIAFGIILVVCVCLCIRARYGMDWADESFYLALAKRFWNGDRFFREEWFPTQLVGVLLLPIYSLHRWIAGNDEGIILFVRYGYVIFSGMIAVYVYWVLNRADIMRKRAALAVSLLYLFYTRGSIVTLSYYSIGLGTFLLYLLLSLHKESKGIDFLRGVLFSISVICMPYMVFYFIIIVIIDVGQVIERRKCWKKGVLFYVGILVSAVIFLLYGFWQGSFKDIIYNLPYILQDPEHEGTIMDALIGFVSFMIKVFYRFLLWPVLLEFAGIGWYLWKKRDNRKYGLVLKGFAYILFFLQAVYLRTYLEGGVLLAFLILAIQIALINGYADKQLLKTFFWPGMLFGLIWIIGSNVGQRVFNMGGLIADIWAVAVIYEDIGQSAGLKRWLKGSSVAILLGITALVRVCDIYHDASLEKLTECVTRGAWKGIYTTEQRNIEYIEVLDTVEKYVKEEDLLAVGGVNSWIYLEMPAGCGAFSVWKVDFADERNVVYYKRYPGKEPDVIFLLSPHYGAYEAWQFSSHGSNLEGQEQLEIEGWFKTFLEDGNYTQYEEPCGVFYVKE